TGPRPSRGSLLTRAFRRLRQHGPMWFVDEVRNPGSDAGRALSSGLRAIAARFRALRLGRMRPMAQDALLAVYDLRCEPNTFDLIHFLMEANRRRKEEGFSSLHVAIVASAVGTRRTEGSTYLAAVSESSLRDRVANVLVPLAW